MEAWAIARALHVIGVVVWIGGVAFVTTVLLPAIAALPDAERRFELFDRLERRFAAQARIATTVVGATGFYLVYELDLWHRFREAPYWWMHAMVCVWAVFTAMLFVIEPWFLHRRLEERSRRDPAGTMRLVRRLHHALLAISIATIAGAVAGVHGLLL